MSDRELMQQAFDAMSYGNADEREAARIALRERLAQPEQEPVAQIIALGQYEFPGLEWLSADHSFRAPIGTLLYTTPPQRKPLTGDELADLWYKQSLDWMEFARAIEAAHGIKGS